MDKYITSLIQKKNRVIIPEFGAFIIKQGQPKSVVFNEFLKYNDGLLVNEIKETEKVSEDEAIQKIEQYVSDINGKLNIGQQHVIEGFGILKKDANGRIIFKSDESVKASGAPTPEKPEDKPKETPQPKKEEVPIELDEEKDKNNEKKEEKKEKVSKTPDKTAVPLSKPAKTESNTSAAREVKPKVEATQKAQPEKKKETVTKKTETTTTVTEKKPSEQKKYSYSAEKSNRSRNIIWISMIAVIVALIAVWLIVNRDYLFGDEEQTEQAAITLRPEGADATAEKPAEEQNETTQGEQTQAQPIDANKQEAEQAGAPSSVQASTAEKKYYVVAGCFQYEKNADNYVSYLRDQGFDAEKFGKYGNLHAVSFDSFTSYNQAVNEMNKLKNSTEPEAWVLYY